MDRTQLREEYRQLCADQRKMLEIVASEKRDFNSDETAKYDRMTGRLGEITKTIENLERLEAAEAALQATRALPPGVLGDPQAGNPSSAVDSITVDDWRQFDAANRGDKKHREAWLRYMRAGEVLPQLRALSTNTSEATGQYLAPKWMFTEVTKYLLQAVNMRRLCTLNTSNTNMDIPVMQPPTAVWKAEAAAFTETDPTFANKSLVARKLTALIKVSEELLQDAQIDLESELLMSIQVAFAEAQEKAYLVGAGSGSNEPNGIIPAAAVGKTAAAVAAVTADELIDWYHSLKPQYRTRGVMFMNDATIAAVRKLKGSDNNYLWVMGFGGEPDRLLGKPIFANSNIDTMAATKRIGVFFDPKFYRIMDRPGLFTQKLVELYAGNGQVGFRVYMRTDGILTIQETAQALKNADA